jgi:hypothetical protein
MIEVLLRMFKIFIMYADGRTCHVYGGMYEF